MAKIQPRMQQSEERGDGLREKMIAVNRVSWQHWWRLDECCSGLGERIGERA